MPLFPCRGVPLVLYSGNWGDTHYIDVASLETHSPPGMLVSCSKVPYNTAKSELRVVIQPTALTCNLTPNAPIYTVKHQFILVPHKLYVDSGGHATKSVNVAYNGIIFPIIPLDICFSLRTIYYIPCSFVGSEGATIQHMITCNKNSPGLSAVCTCILAHGA